ncbi:MAG: hypothetical protein AMXMBFR84_22490 [Candidatus Hydrogenedentota bacterium]
MKNVKRVVVKAAVFGLKLAVVVGLFVFIFRPETFGFRADLFKNITPWTIVETCKQLDPVNVLLWLGFASIAKLTGITCGILRWNLLLRGQGLKLPMLYLAKCWFWGRAIGLFLPGTVGLDGYRLVESSTFTREPIKCTSVIAVEKLTGFIALFGLVFLTVPLGLRVFNFNLAMLTLVLLCLAAFVSVTLMLLMNPRVIQVLAAAFPVPARIRDKVNKLGFAVTAYSGQRARLLLALLLAFGVHLGICFMYFGTAMAIKAPNTSLLDILFASPLVIVASVFGPTVSGAGARELVFGALLGDKSGMANAVLFGHLGLWIGEVIPLIVSLPLLLTSTRPKRDVLLEEVADLRHAIDEADQSVHLPEADVMRYRNTILSTLLAGLAAGGIGGACIGFVEASWVASTLSGLSELGAFWWGTIVYAVLFGGLGLGVGAALLFFYLIADRLGPASVSFGITLGTILAVGVLIIGRWRYQRDVLIEHALSRNENLAVFGAALAVFAVGFAVGGGIAFALRNRTPLWSRALATGALIAVIAAAFFRSAMYVPEAEQRQFDPLPSAQGPNIILVAIDTLRADYLRAYRPDAKAYTPNIDAFLGDSVLFASSFAQSSWTKASFGTIFSGMHPQAHKAVTKSASLPNDVETLAEGLFAGGYYTQGFPNNANIFSVFNYGQGFVQYKDLLPDRYCGATESAARLSLYEVVRRVVETINAKVLGGRIVISNFYQPGEVITKTALEWIDGDERPAGAPFYLFLHYMDPHDPFRDPERPGKGYARVQRPNPDPEKFREAFIRSYNYEIEYLDEQLGKLFQGLKDRGIYDDALIVFTSDHGEEFCEHGGFWHGLSLYEEQIRIPLAIKLPGNRHAGARQTQIARHIDIAPTILLTAGLQPLPAMQGEPLFSFDGNPVDNSVSETYAHLDFEGIQLKAVRTPESKLITSNENKRKYAPIELFDLQTDPAEKNNLAGKNVPSEQQLLDLLDQFQETVSIVGVANEQTTTVDKATEEALRSIGYGE